MRNEEWILKKFFIYLLKIFYLKFKEGAFRYVSEKACKIYSALSTQHSALLSKHIRLRITSKGKLIDPLL